MVVRVQDGAMGTIETWTRNEVQARNEVDRDMIPWEHAFDCLRRMTVLSNHDHISIASAGSLLTHCFTVHVPTV